jgi:glycerol kinase
VILAIDQGTTGTTCLVFDEQAELIGRAYREFEQRFPRPGWVEHDPTDRGFECIRDDAGIRPRFEPAMSADERETLLGDWQRALERARALAAE